MAEVAITVQILSCKPTVAIERCKETMPRPLDYTAKVSVGDHPASLEAVDASVSLETTSTVIDIVLHPV